MTVINEEIYRPLTALDKIYLSTYWNLLENRHREIRDTPAIAYHISLYTKLNAQKIGNLDIKTVSSQYHINTITRADRIAKRVEYC
jgi:hypothetical protein